MDRRTENGQRDGFQANDSARSLEIYADRGKGGAPAASHIPEVLSPLVERLHGPMVTRNMMRRQADRGLNLVTILALVMKRKWLVLGLFTIVFGPAIAYVLSVPKKYEAEVKLILKKNRSEVTIGGTAPNTAAALGEGEVAAEIELLKGRELYEQVVRAAGLAKGKSALAQAEAVGQMDANLKIQQIGKTSIISLRNTSPSAETAAKVPNLLAELYLKKHIEVHGNNGAARFFDERTAFYQRQLEEAQTALTHFRQTGDVSLINEQKQGYLRRASDLKAALEEADSQARDGEVRLRLLAKQRSAQPLQVETGSRTVRTSALAERLKGSLIDLQARRAELLTKYDPQYRLVKEADQQLSDMRAALERESQPQVVDTSQAPNPLRQSLEAESLRLESQVAGLRVRREALVADLSEYRARQSRLEELTGNHNDLERSVKIAEENFLLYQRKLEEARLGDALDKRQILNVSVLERAAVPILPAPQHRAYLLLFGFFAAGFGALGGAFITDYLERNLPALAPVGGQRASDRHGLHEGNDREAVKSVSPIPQYYRRRDVASGKPKVVEVASTAVGLRGDPWRELMERRSRALEESEIDAQ